MALNLWLRVSDEELFRQVCDIPLTEYSAEILSGVLRNPGVLAKVGKQFVLGRRGVWVPEGTYEREHQYQFVYIKNSSAYPEGLILTPYSRIDVKYHLRNKTIDERMPFQREELMGNDEDDFVERVFRTYCDSLIRKQSDRDYHLVLYSRLGRGVMF